MNRRSSTAPESRDLAGLYVLISGGTTGIGRAAALRLADEGASVFIFGRHDPELQDALADARARSGAVTGMTADQSDPTEVLRVFEETDRTFPKLDVLINNAAVGGDDLTDESDENIARIVQSNLCGYLYCSKQAIRRMERQGNGHIVNIGSITAEKLKPGGEIYTATKAGVHAFSESIRKSVQKSGIRVSLIEPGKTGSDLIDETPAEQRDLESRLEMLKAEDVAEAICFCLRQSRRAVITSLQIEPFAHQ